MKNISINKNSHSKSNDKGFVGNISSFFDGKPRVNKAEKALLMDAICNRGGEIVEPANDDVKTMEIIVSLYNKGLVRIDFKKDRLVVRDLGGE